MAGVMRANVSMADFSKPTFNAHEFSTFIFDCDGECHLLSAESLPGLCRFARGATFTSHLLRSRSTHAAACCSMIDMASSARHMLPIGCPIPAQATREHVLPTTEVTLYSARSFPNQESSGTALIP